MKRKFNYLLLIAVATLSLGFVSCSDDDDFDSSIFDTVNHPLDKTAFTFPLDTFVKVNFLEPYNLRFIYRMEDIGSDMRKNLVPAAYDKSCELAVLSKYLWYDVYKENSPETFLQENSPRIIHVVGSKNYNPTQGTEVLGVAEGGLKITLYNVNNLNVNDMDMMNEYFFKTMHHEFGHILDQTHLRPTAFNTISSGHYNATTWQETPDSVSIGNGFVSSYASSSASEDWVETLANYITMDSVRWLGMLNSASYEWEEIDYDKALYEDKMKGDYSRDTIGYLNVKDNGDKKIYRRVCQRNGDGTVDLDEEVLLKAGSKFAVVATLSHDEGQNVNYDVDSSGTYYNMLRHESSVSAGQSFEKDSGDAGWSDLSEAKCECDLSKDDGHADNQYSQCAARLKAVSEPVESVKPQNVKVNAPAGKILTYNGKVQIGVAAGSGYTLTGTTKATNAGKYTAKATLKTDADYDYSWADGMTDPKTVSWQIKKAANPLKVKGRSVKIKASAVKNKTLTLAVTKVMAFTGKGQGRVSYTKASGNTKIIINKTTGKVTLKKGLKKGRYVVKVKVKASGNKNYNASSVKTIVITIIVK